jgi:4-hydroxybenzoate polyprenyltransferase
MLIFAIIPFATGYLYSKGVKLGRYSFRLKGGLGVKNIVVCLTWGIFIVGLTGCKHFIPVALIFLLYGAKVFINSIIDDFKDIEGDMVAGVRTLPIYFGEQRTCNFLVGIHVITHIILLFSIIANEIAFEPVILFVSFICGLICILNYTKTESYSKTGLALFKDLESSITLGILLL